MKIKMSGKVVLITFILTFLIAGLAGASSKPAITADKSYFDPDTGLYILDGNVRIEGRGRVITAGYARVNITGMEVWATGGITFKKGNYSFSGGSVYVYGKGTYAKIDGGANYSIPGLSIVSDSGEYNWETANAVFKGNVKVNQNGNYWETDKVTYNVDSNSFK